MRTWCEHPNPFSEQTTETNGRFLSSTCVPAGIVGYVLRPPLTHRSRPSQPHPASLPPLPRASSRAAEAERAPRRAPRALSRMRRSVRARGDAGRPDQAVRLGSTAERPAEHSRSSSPAAAVTGATSKRRKARRPPARASTSASAQADAEDPFAYDEQDAKGAPKFKPPFIPKKASAKKASAKTASAKKIAAKKAAAAKLARAAPRHQSAKQKDVFDFDPDAED